MRELICIFNGGYPVFSQECKFQRRGDFKLSVPHWSGTVIRVDMYHVKIFEELIQAGCYEISRFYIQNIIEFVKFNNYNSELPEYLIRGLN